jgi:outer membrane protein OmpA-like peptidoglycan-associated protein
VTIAPGKLDLAERVYFHSDGDVLEPRSFALLDSIAALLGAHPELARIRVVGHTDDRGGAGHNRRLSRRRAVAVVSYLVEHGVAAERLEAVGLGQAAPLADNLSAAGRAANRRVELVIAERGSPRN